MYRSLLVLIGLIISQNAFGQTSWQILPDSGLNVHITSRQRYEDVYFTDSVTGYAAAFDGYIYKTADAGRNWKIQLGLPNQAQFRSIEFLDDKLTGVAGCIDFHETAYRTIDGGNTWAEIGSMISDTVHDGYKRGVCGIAHNANTFYLVGSWFSRQAIMYKSIDKGVNWRTIYLDTSLINCAVDVHFKSADTGFITGAYLGTSAYQHPTMSVVIKTTDGGLSWKRVFSDTTIGGRIWKIQAISNQTLVGSIEPAYSDTVAMIKSNDGGNSWTIIGTGFHAGVTTGYRTQGIGFINGQHGWLGGWYGGIFETKDAGLTWDTLRFGMNVNRIFILDSTHVFAGGSDIYFYGNKLPFPTAAGTGQLALLPHALFPISPNPATNKVKIQFDLMKDTYVLLDVSSIDTKRSWEIKSGWLPIGHYTYEWDGQHAPAGNYIVWLGTNEIPIAQKFVLQH